MSLQWTLVAGFLFSEIVVALLLSFPIISPSKLHKVFKSKVLKSILQQSSKYFKFVFFALVLFLCDSIRELRKYSDISAEESDKFVNLDSEMLIQLRLFRAQRNFYVCGFSLVLAVVIQRLITLINEQAALLKALKNKPQSADDDNESDQTKGETIGKEATHHKHFEKLQDRITELEWELRREKKEKELVGSLTREYKELTREGGDKKSK